MWLFRAVLPFSGAKKSTILSPSTWLSDRAQSGRIIKCAEVRIKIATQRAKKRDGQEIV